MRKPELAAAIAERADLSKDKASQVLNVILDEITGSVSDGKDVSLIGFGTFTVRERAARTGKNPQTGEPLTIGQQDGGFQAGQRAQGRCCQVKARPGTARHCGGP